MKASLSLLLVFFCSFVVNAQWEEIPLPNKYPSTKFITHGDYLFTYESPGGVFRSNDGGSNWVRKMVGLQPSENYLTLLSYNNFLYISLGVKGVFQSNDNGDSWSRLTELPSHYYTSLTVSNNRIYALSSTGYIFMSDDNGENWGEVNDPESVNHNQGTRENRIFASLGHLFIYVQNEFFQTDNNGETWTPVAFNNSLGTISYVIDLSVNESSIWISAYSDNLGPVILSSQDAGLNWSFIDIQSNFWPTDIMVEGQNVAYVLNHNIYYSTDGGVSWNNEFHSSAENLLFSFANKYLLSSPTAYYYFEPNTKGFTEVESAGISASDLLKMIDMNDSLIFLQNTGTFLSMNKSSGQVKEYTSKNASLSYVSRMAYFNGSLYGLFNRDIFRFDPDLGDWVESFKHPDGGLFFDIAATNNDFYARGVNNLFVSTSESDTLIDSGVGILPGAVMGAYTSGTLKAVYTDNLYISQDGSDWRTEDPDYYLASYTAFETFKSKIYTCTINGLFYGDYSGSIWNEMTSELFETVYLVKGFEDRLYVSTDHGVFISIDEGLSWIQKNEGQNEFIVKSLLFDDQFIYANTIGGGIWRRPIEELYAPPTIEGLSSPESFLVGEPINLSIENIKISDVDSNYPYDFELIILEGDDYVINPDGSLTPTSLDFKEIIVNIQVFDGHKTSEVFQITIAIVDPLGIENIETQVVYPNPTNSIIHVATEKNGPFEVDVYSFSGNLLRSVSISARDNFLEIDLSQVSRGTYIIKISGKDYLRALRVIKK